MHDLMFRLATLQAGLEVEVDLSVSSQFRFVRSPVVTEVVDGRPELVHRFLTTFGPARPAHLAAWLGHRPAAAREWWEPVADELAPVSVEGRKLWTHDVDALGTAEPPRGVRLLPAYDPLLELADRELLVAPADRRRTVWQAAANPGVLWVDGEVAGIWRQRRTGTRLVLTVEPFEELSRRRRAAAESDAATIAEHAGLEGAELRVA